jgi:hypothetical protein
MYVQAIHLSSENSSTDRSIESDGRLACGGSLRRLQPSGTERTLVLIVGGSEPLVVMAAFRAALFGHSVPASTLTDNGIVFYDEPGSRRPGL